MSVFDDPRVVVQQYLVRPAVHDELDPMDAESFSLCVSDGGKWGWSIQRGTGTWSPPTKMNRKGRFITESRGSEANRFRRWPVEEALTIALKNVDQVRLNGKTAAEWVEWRKSRK